MLALLVDSGNSVDWQLNEEHDMDNQDEIERLKQTGVSVQVMTEITFLEGIRDVFTCQPVIKQYTPSLDLTLQELSIPDCSKSRIINTKNLIK